MSIAGPQDLPSQDRPPQGLERDIAAAVLDYYVTDALRTESADYAVIAARLSDPRTIRLLHAAMGLVTEAAEFLDQLKKHIFYGKLLDYVNLGEELGDSTWYQRVALDALETTWLTLLERNSAKLHARFPEKFNEQQAVHRDLDQERRALEGESGGV